MIAFLTQLIGFNDKKFFCFFFNELARVHTA